VAARRGRRPLRERLNRTRRIEPPPEAPVFVARPLQIDDDGTSRRVSQREVVQALQHDPPLTERNLDRCFDAAAR
jgi:hypothetical protein